MEPLKVFIGSSTEACVRGIAPRLTTLLTNNGFKATMWSDHDDFAPGEYTLDALLNIAREVDFALFVFSKDDKVEIRGATHFIPRDNVLLEYGLFTSQLGRLRVGVVQEEGVKLPVDVNGMGVARFTNGDDPHRNATLEVAVNDLAKRWKRLDAAPPFGQFADSELGFTATLKSAHETLECIREQLWRFSRHQAKCDEPVDFDPKGYCVSTYAEALSRVSTRFWTTTYLSSGFWTKKQARVLAANQKMMERLGRGGEARRLFLVQQSLKDEIDAWKEQHILDRKIGRVDRLKIRQEQLTQLRENVAELQKAGCKVRVVHDASSAFHKLPTEMGFQQSDSELAIYDRFRVDVFKGGSSGTISGVACFTPAIDTFDAYLEQAEAYFCKLWDNASEMSDFMEELAGSLAAAEARLNYETNWLAFYEFALGPDDTNLKIAESKRVEEVLRKLGKWGRLERCLDVGTCTGRYPMLLSAGLSPSGTVIGIDDDVDCVRFAKANVAQRCPGNHQIDIRKDDFAAADFRERFDVITCMLGTLSHFGRDMTRPVGQTYKDKLQDILVRMATLLRSDGHLILGTWSDHARTTQHMLGIYKEGDRKRLADWTPCTRELRQRLRQAGLEIVEEVQPDVRLDFTVCRPA